MDNLDDYKTFLFKILYGFQKKNSKALLRSGVLLKKIIADWNLRDKGLPQMQLKSIRQMIAVMQYLTN